MLIGQASWALYAVDAKPLWLLLLTMVGATATAHHLALNVLPQRMTLTARV